MSTSLNRIRTVSGFTLIEVMIVVAIVGILAAVAYPSYQDHMRSSRRADAQAALLELAQFMERRFTETNQYDQGAPGVNAADTLPQSNHDGIVVELIGGVVPDPLPAAAYYYLSLAAVAANTFTLQAAPIVASPQDGDGNMQLTETGAKSWDRDNNNNYAVPGEMCWKKYC